MVGQRPEVRLHLFGPHFDRSGLVIIEDPVMQDHARHQSDHEEYDEKPHSQTSDN